jgi:hypothetical protein
MLYEHSIFVGCDSEEGTVVRPAKGKEHSVGELCEPNDRSASAKSRQ